MFFVFIIFVILFIILFSQFKFKFLQDDILFLKFLGNVFMSEKNPNDIQILNEKNSKSSIQYVFDITYKNGLDEETNIPYYEDLYLDITVKNDKIEVLDEDELQEALDNKEITKEQFDLANKTKDELIKTIKNKTNKHMNLDIKKYLK